MTGATLFAELVATSDAVAATRSRLGKAAALEAFLRSLAGDEIAIGLGFLTGWPRQGKLGVGWALAGRSLQEAAEPPEVASLTLSDVDAVFDRLAKAAGPGSAGERRRLFDELVARATEPERRFLVGLVTGEIRQGAVEGVLADAVAKAAEVPVAQVQRATMLAGDLGTVATALLTEGVAALSRYRIELFRPVQPMLAASAADIDEAMASLGTAALEYKVDGARVQIHKSGSRVACFSRNLNDVTAAIPEIVELVGSLPVRDAVLDGEVVALDGAGRPRPFQVTMRRFGRRQDVASLISEIPLSAFFFDLLTRDGEELLDRTEAERWAALSEIVPDAQLVPRLVTADPEAARAFFDGALSAGHEGVMAKAVDSRYEAGRRGSSWLKVKRAVTLDLVVLAAEWGNGRRRGWLSNLHLGARDPTGGPFVMLGKTFKGMTDELLRWQTERFLALEERREGHIVWVRPEQVVEVAFDGVQASTQYPGGVALRFARVLRYREDKSAQEADTIDAVRAIHARQG